MTILTIPAEFEERTNNCTTPLQLYEELAATILGRSYKLETIKRR